MKRTIQQVFLLLRSITLVSNGASKIILDLCFVVISIVYKFLNIWLRQTKVRDRKPILERTDGRTYNVCMYVFIDGQGNNLMLAAVLRGRMHALYYIRGAQKK